MRTPSSSRVSSERPTRVRRFLTSPRAVLRDRLVRLWPARRTRRPVTDDPEWATALSVPIHVRVDGEPKDTCGVVTARRHPTGWFITASHNADASAAELADFRHFVCVRVYLLLRQGPRPGAWVPDASGELWRAGLPSAAGLDGTRIPDGVPDSWTSPTSAVPDPLRNEAPRNRALSHLDDRSIPHPRAETS